MKKTAALLLPLLALSACEIGPDYKRPPVDTPAAYKEAAGPWQKAAPMDTAPRGDWWAIYQDPLLNALEKRVDISNQNLMQAEANYRAAVAIADQTRAGLFPTVSLTSGATRSGNGGSGGTLTNGVAYSGGGARATTTYNLSASGSWTIDIWGRIRREVEADEANAQASAADLAGARLSAQAELATDYFALRAQDQLLRLLDQNVADDKKILTIVSNQYKAGVAAQSDLLAARTQYESVQSTEINSRLKRAQLEHAIAVLIGLPASGFSLTPQPGVGTVPYIPAGVPSTLLQRRPDIAGAERRMAAANADIGVAEAAYFPDITLSADYGFSAQTIGKLISTGASLWSFGANASELLLDFGARDAATEEARANYESAAAGYKQIVLAAFQNVEDNLAAQSVLSDQEKMQTAATEDARRSEQISLNQYKQGIVAYNNVLQAQITRLQDEQASLTLLNDRLSASVALIEALGGGWAADRLPNP